MFFSKTNPAFTTMFCYLDYKICCQLHVYTITGLMSTLLLTCQHRIKFISIRDDNDAQICKGQMNTVHEQYINHSWMMCSHSSETSIKPHLTPCLKQMFWTLDEVIRIQTSWSAPLNLCCRTALLSHKFRNRSIYFIVESQFKTETWNKVPNGYAF